MKRNMRLIGLAACLISCSSLAVAQDHPEPQERQQYEQRLPHEVPNPEKIATQMTDRMQESLQLTEKQYKKIYKLNLKEQKEHFKAMQNSGEPLIMGEGNFPDDMGERPMMNKEQNVEDIQKKAAEAKKKKIKKIPTPEQYAKWQTEQATARQKAPQMRMHKGNHTNKI